MVMKVAKRMSGSSSSAYHEEVVRSSERSIGKIRGTQREAPSLYEDLCAHLVGERAMVVATAAEQLVVKVEVQAQACGVGMQSVVDMARGPHLVEEDEVPLRRVDRHRRTSSHTSPWCATSSQ
jgi:hypothetical protein